MTIVTNGINHIGLTVSNLEESANFFIQILGWKEVKRDMKYPSIFISDGELMLTLWSVKLDSKVDFDRINNVGLHHLAFDIKSEFKLKSIYNKLLKAGIKIEFEPEFLNEGPAKHMICYDPSGIRVEFIWNGIDG